MNLGPVTKVFSCSEALACTVPIPPTTELPDSECLTLAKLNSQPKDRRAPIVNPVFQPLEFKRPLLPKPTFWSTLAKVYPALISDLERTPCAQTFEAGPAMVENNIAATSTALSFCLIFHSPGKKQKWV